MKAIIPQTILKMSSQFIDSFLYFFYPPFCLSCRRNFTPLGNPYFCPQCWGQQQAISPNRCPRCLEEIDCSVAEKGNEIMCWHCLKRDFVFDRLYACLEFHGVTRMAINQLKFQGLRPLAFSISQVVENNLPHDFDPQQYDYLLPIPLHVWRRLQRGFNQTYEIAKHLGRSWQLPIMTRVLKRIKPAPPQTKSTYRARQKQVKGRFALLKSDLVRDKSILLFDDIATTRFTVNECARLLKVAGAKKVDVLTVALTIM